MVFGWLIVWVLTSTPQLRTWNGWLVSLIVCVVIDVLNA